MRNQFIIPFAKATISLVMMVITVVMFATATSSIKLSPIATTSVDNLVKETIDAQTLMVRERNIVDSKLVVDSSKESSDLQGRLKGYVRVEYAFSKPESNDIVVRYAEDIPAEDLKQHKIFEVGSTIAQHKVIKATYTKILKIFGFNFPSDESHYFDTSVTEDDILQKHVKPIEKLYTWLDTKPAKFEIESVVKQYYGSVLFGGENYLPINLKIE